MELPNWLKIIWWIVLIIVLLTLLFLKIDIIIADNGNFFDIVIFLVLVVLLVAPLFQEVELLGFRIKRELDQFKSEVRENIINLRSDIQNSIDLNASYNPQIYFGSSAPPPSDSKIHDITGPFRQILEETLESYGIERPTDEEVDFEISSTSEYLFKVRHAIEKELRNVWNDRFGDRVSRRPVPIHHIIKTLIEAGLISPKLGSVIREVYAICSPAVHGEEVSDDQVEFVQNVAPDLIASLRAIY